MTDKQKYEFLLAEYKEIIDLIEIYKTKGKSEMVYELERVKIRISFELKELEKTK